MANTDNDTSNRGLASADQKTKEKVAKMGGAAYHQKRGQHGSDSKDQKSASSTTQSRDSSSND